MTWTKIPFQYRGEKDFYPELNNWMSSVFYDSLPAKGYEIREEQIYTAYHMVTALKEKKTLFAEAGSGTGKTFAYLLALLCYARLRGSPVILSSASPLLQDQLVGKGGDIATLSRQLGLDIDARLAKKPEHYICEIKVEALQWGPRQRGKKTLLDWAECSVRGERSEIPDISEETWNQASWDKSLNCNLCKRRGYCRFAKARRHFQAATDFVVCEHEVFLSDLWGREEIKQQRGLPYLPDYCAVVFDEGHLVELPLARSLGREINNSKLEHIIDGSTNVHKDQYQRDIVYSAGQVVAKHSDVFFKGMRSSVVEDVNAERLHIRKSKEVLQAAQDLSRAVELFQDELVIEESMNEGTPFAVALGSYQNQLDQLRQGLHLMLAGDDSVTWWEPEEQSVWTLPREYGDSLHNELLSRDIPVIFTSATLASGNDFSYMHHITGARNPLHSQSEVPFDLEAQVTAFVPLDNHRDAKGVTATAMVKDLLMTTGGKTLVLCGSPGDVTTLKDNLDTKALPFKVFWEGDSDKGKLIEKFRANTTSVLIGSGFWEGVDVPGDSLSQVIVFTLPFPQPDPLLEARRREAKEKGLDPFAIIDTPAMLIKLRQGFGRLIRTKSDTGIISVLDSRPNSATHDLVLQAIPRGVKVVHSLEELKKQTTRR